MIKITKNPISHSTTNAFHFSLNFVFSSVVQVVLVRLISQLYHLKTELSIGSGIEAGSYPDVNIRSFKLRSLETEAEMSSSIEDPKVFQPRAILTCQPEISHPFQDQVLNLETIVTVGRSPAIQQEQFSTKLGSASSGSGSPSKGNDVCNENSCRFDTRVLSKYHATIYYENNKFWIRDSNSTNGTFVNGKQISKSGTPVQLSHGDSLRFGVTVHTKKQPSACSEAATETGAGDEQSESRDKEDGWTEERAVCATFFIPRQLSAEETDPDKETSCKEVPLKESLLTEHDYVALKGIASRVHEATRQEQYIREKMAALSKVVEEARGGISKARRNTAEFYEVESRLINTQEQLAVTTMVLGVNGSAADKDAQILELLHQKQKYEEVAKQRLMKATQERLKCIKIMHSQKQEREDMAKELDARKQVIRETEKKLELMTKDLEASERRVTSLRGELVEAMKHRNEKMDGAEEGGTKREANEEDHKEPEESHANRTPFNLLDAENNLANLLQYFEHQSVLNSDENRQSELILSVVNVLTAVRLETRKDQDHKPIRIPFGDRRELHEGQSNSKAEAAVQTELPLKKETDEVDNAAAGEVKDELNPSTAEAEAQIQILQAHNQTLQGRLAQMSNFLETSCSSLESSKQRFELHEAKFQAQEQEVVELRQQLEETNNQLAGKEALLQQLRAEVVEAEKTADDLAMLNRRLEGDVLKLRNSLHAKGTEMEEVKLELHVLRQGAEEMLELERRTTHLQTLEGGLVTMQELRQGNWTRWMKECWFIVGLIIIVAYFIGEYLRI